VKKEERTNLTPKRRHLHFGSVVVAGLLFLWFSHNFLTNHFQLKALQLAKSEDYCGAIDVLKPWYHPVFRTTINDLEPIARHLARWHDKMEMTDEAAYWYQEAQKCAPDDPGLAYEIEQFRQVAVTR
jgi:arabinogalactan endo-1,4-beta-galactosidase